MRQLPSFFSLRAFESAARFESFTLAGQELHQTTSAISHQVRAFESWLSLSLFVRHARRVTLTQDGRRLLENLDRKSTRLNSSHVVTSRMPSSA